MAVNNNMELVHDTCKVCEALAMAMRVDGTRVGWCENGHVYIYDPHSELQAWRVWDFAATKKES